MNFLILILLIILPFFLTFLSNKKITSMPDIGTFIISGWISYYWFEVAIWPIVLAALIALIFVYYFYPYDTPDWPKEVHQFDPNYSRQRKISFSNIALIFGCIIGSLLSYFMA